MKQRLVTILIFDILNHKGTIFNVSILGKIRKLLKKKRIFNFLFFQFESNIVEHITKGFNGKISAIT